jgi:hypothetical protein
MNGTVKTNDPELLITAKTQRWSPEEFLRTLIERLTWTSSVLAQFRR